MKYKKGFSYFAVCWGIVFAIFNISCFAIPGDITGRSIQGSAFWPCYLCIDAAFLGQLGCACIAFRAENSRKMFYNLSLITLGYCAVIATGAVGVIGMLLPWLPDWGGAVVCLAMLAFYAVAVIKARAAVDIVSQKDEEIENKTRPIRSMTATAEGIMARAHNEAGRQEAKKVYEALRYSDPMSNEKLNAIEDQIGVKLAGFAEAVAGGDEETVKAMSSDLVTLIGDRNRQCTLLKK